MRLIDPISTPSRGVPDRGHYAFARPPDLPGVEIMAVANSQRLWKLYHTGYSICTILASGGVSEWTYRHRAYVSGPGSLMAVEPGETHCTTRITSAGQFYVLLLEPALVGEFAHSAGLDAQPHIRVPATSEPRLVAAFIRFHRAQEAGAPLLERQSLLADCLRLLLTQCAEEPPVVPRFLPRLGLLRAHDYLVEHCTQNVSLDELAGIAGLSRFHFLHIFEQNFALPPHAFQTSLRIEQARRMLRAGVPAGAIDVGFSDQSHLIRQFKRAWGVTPAHYAAMVGARGRNIVPFAGAAPWKDHPALPAIGADSAACSATNTSIVVLPPAARTGAASPARPSHEKDHPG